MADLDFDEVRLKEESELSKEEKALVTKNWNDLTDDEQSAFANLKPEEGGEGGEGGKGKEEESDLPKTQEELDALIGTKVTEGVTKGIDEFKQNLLGGKKKEGEEDTGMPDFSKVFPEGYKASNWQDAFAKAWPTILEGVVGWMSKQGQERQKKLDAINAEFDKELVTIRKDNPQLPVIGTKEGDKFEAELAQIGVEHKGITTMTESFDIYKAQHPDLFTGKGGKSATTTKGTPVEGDQSKNRLARNVATSGSSPDGKTNRPVYTNIHGKSMDTLLEEKKAELEE
jgi:hypothetical protein